MCVCVCVWVCVRVYVPQGGKWNKDTDVSHVLMLSSGCVTLRVFACEKTCQIPLTPFINTHTNTHVQTSTRRRLFLPVYNNQAHAHKSTCRLVLLWSPLRISHSISVFPWLYYHILVLCEKPDYHNSTQNTISICAQIVFWSTFTLVAHVPSSSHPLLVVSHLSSAWTTLIHLSHWTVPLW